MIKDNPQAGLLFRKETIPFRRKASLTQERQPIGAFLRLHLPPYAPLKCLTPPDPARERLRRGQGDPPPAQETLREPPDPLA